MLPMLSKLLAVAHFTEMIIGIFNHLFKKNIFVGVVIFVINPFSPIYAQTAESIHNEYLGNYGNKSVIDSIYSVFLSGEGFDSQTKESYTLNVYKQLPLFSCYERIVYSDTTYFIFDGQKSCIGSKPERHAITILNRLFASNQSYFRIDQLFNEYVYVGKQCMFMGIVTENNTEFYRLDYKDEKFAKFFLIDTLTNNLVKESTLNIISNAKTETVYSDFQIIQNIKMPMQEFSQHSIDGRSTSTSTIKFKSVIFNKNIDKQKFLCN